MKARIENIAKLANMLVAELTMDKQIHSVSVEENNFIFKSNDDEFVFSYYTYT